MIVHQNSHSREVGEVGFTDDVCESRRSKLVPYGLLSSSFHMMPALGDDRRRQLHDGKRRWYFTVALRAGR